MNFLQNLNSNQEKAVLASSKYTRIIAGAGSGKTRVLISRVAHLIENLGVYPGSLGNYGGIFKKLPVVTIELPSATSMPSLREQRDIWKDMLTWLRRNITAKTTS